MRLPVLLVAAAACLAVPASASASILHRTAPPPKPAPRIVNGTQAGTSEYPAQAGLYIDLDDDGYEDAIVVLEEAGLTVPTTGTARGGDRSGAMSEYRGYILAEMQSLARRHPGATW